MPNIILIHAPGAIQFLMVLDTSVMNVAVSQLVSDLNTNVDQIQAAITFYALAMAAFMMTGASLVMCMEGARYLASEYSSKREQLRRYGYEHHNRC